MMDKAFVKLNKHLSAIKYKDHSRQLQVTVFYNCVPVASFNCEKLAERKLAAVELVERKICNHQTVAQLCGFHRNTITKLLALKSTLGITALFDENRGLKKPLKYTAEIRATIEQLLAEHPDWSDRKIAKLASEQLTLDVHRTGVARIRTANVPASAVVDERFVSKDQLLELSKIAAKVDQEKNAHAQLTLNFETNVQLKQKQEALAQLPPLQSTNKTEQQLIKRLQAGQYNPFAGRLMHHLFLQEIKAEKLFDGLPPAEGQTYQHQDILTTLYFSIANGLKSIETLKLVNPTDLGSVLGRDRAPDKDIIRKKLANLAETHSSDKLIDSFARILLKRQRIDDEVFFIDGHFLPYYGLQMIAKGYYIVRRMAMKGNELYVISDLKGRPLFFITESNEIDFRPIIAHAANKLIEFGIKRPILTFDRGGYGIYFFSELDRKADFVTWAKYLGDKQLERFDDDDFKFDLTLNHKRYLVAEQWRDVSESKQTARDEGRSQPVKMRLRLIVIHNIDSGKRMGIYKACSKRNED